MDGRRTGEREVNQWHTGPEEARERDSGSSSPAAILLFSLIGATVTTAAVGQLRRTFGWFYTQLSRSEPYVYWEDIPRGPNRCGDAWRYYQRTREANEDQRKRVERIMHMQDMFKKERSKCRDYRTRNGHNPTYNQHSRGEGWYEDAETFYANQRTNFRSRPREAMQYSMSHHYSVLGLNRSRPEPFSDAEIKEPKMGSLGRKRHRRAKASMGRAKDEDGAARRVAMDESSRVDKCIHRKEARLDGWLWWRGGGSGRAGGRGGALATMPWVLGADS